MIKKMTVEAFLNWAFAQELTKPDFVTDQIDRISSYGSAWGAIEAYAKLGTSVDLSKYGYGVTPDFSGCIAPHPDAVLAGNAVLALADIGFEIPQGWNPFPEWPDEHGLVAAEVERVRAEVLIKGDRLSGNHLVRLVTTCAILDHRPDWSATKPRELMAVDQDGNARWFMLAKARDAFGRSYSIETDGYNRRAKRPHSGAYRKYQLDGSIRGLIIDRLEWQLWQDALAVVANHLQSDLESFELAPFVPDRQPWARQRMIEKNVA